MVTIGTSFKVGSQRCTHLTKVVAAARGAQQSDNPASCSRLRPCVPTASLAEMVAVACPAWAAAWCGLGCLKMRNGPVSCCWRLQVYIWAPIYNEDWSAFAPDFKVGS